MSLREHYATVLSEREQERYDIEAELASLEGAEPRNSTEAQELQRRHQELSVRLRIVEESVRNNQSQLYEAERRLSDARQTALSERESAATGELSAAVTAAGMTQIQGGVNAARELPLAFQRPPTPTTGVLSTNGNVTTTIERWNDGNLYRVNRYNNGPNQGRFAEGGRQRLTEAEVRSMGSQLQTQHVQGLRTNLATAEANATTLRQQLSTATTAEQRAGIERQMQDNQRLRQELSQELRRVEARPVRDFIVSGVSFAAMSVAITASYNIIQQAVAANGDLSQVDLAAATAFVTDGQFWATTTGTYFGGMAGRALTAFLPGPFRVLGTIAGGTIGAQLASGNWRDADWAMLGAQTIGSTIGYMLGAFIGSLMGPLAPIAIIVFSIAGAWLAEKALEWIRSVFSPKITPYQFEESGDENRETVEIFADAMREQNLDELDSMSVDQLREQLWVSHQEVAAWQEAGSQLDSDAARVEWRNQLQEKMVRHEQVRRAMDRRRMEFQGFAVANS